MRPGWVHLRLPLPAPFSSLASPGPVTSRLTCFAFRTATDTRPRSGVAGAVSLTILFSCPCLFLPTTALTRSTPNLPTRDQPARTHAPRAVDGFIVSERLLHRIRDCQIRQQVKRQFWPPKDSVGIGALADHGPVWLSLEMERL